MVDARTYRMWGALACREDLPEAALPWVVRALTAPSTGSGHTDRWRQDALRAALPMLLGRVREPDLRAVLIGAAGRESVALYLREGLLGVEDLPTVTAAHRVWPELVVALADRADHLRAATDLVGALDDHGLESVASFWDIRHRSAGSGEMGRPMPDELLDAILERCLAPCASALAAPEAATWPVDWVRSAGSLSWRDGAFGGPAWRMLERCPHRWSDLVGHPRLGRAVQHVLLTHADTRALDDALLEACLPALTCPELAGLPRPSLTQRERLREIAARARRHPRVLEVAADHVHAASSECVRRGRLLSARNLSDDAVHRLAQDLAVVGDNARHLSTLCGRLARLPQPTVVVRAGDDRYESRPGLGWGQDTRITALAHLATNPHTPRDAVVAVLEQLHPAESAALAESDTTPDWLRALVADHFPTDDTTVRLLTDDELDTHPDPAAVLASWLDGAGDDDLFNTVERAVRQSRHCTPDLLLRLPVDDILGHGFPDTAAPILIATCGADPTRWAELSTSLDRLPRHVTLGDFLETLGAASDRQATTNGHTPARAPFQELLSAGD